ncbi:DNA-binding protein [Willisornis vidua]|uniref:DNA-binding protein n=1 Tax=Willisornis vidua TaxID=1566151 RepID=A0ABQ9DRB9_9PASS|nr:DNA-binding protein [Willisornis vidua]
MLTGIRGFVLDFIFLVLGLSFHLSQKKIVYFREPPYMCRDYEKSFNTSSNLFTYQRIHTGDRPYKCLECGKRFQPS